MKQSSLHNRFNFIKDKSSRSCHKDINNNYSFICNEMKGNINYSESKNKYKKYSVKQIKYIKKLKNKSFIFEKYKKKIWRNEKYRGNSQKNHFRKVKNKEYCCSSTTNLEKNSHSLNIKSLDRFNKHNIKIINDNKYNKTFTKKRISNFSTTNNTNNTNIISFHSKQNKYITFKKIRINILTNYGNLSVVGLTGLNLVDKDNIIIDISSAMAVGALPKDLKTIYNKENENRILENIFME